MSAYVNPFGGGQPAPHNVKPPFLTEFDLGIDDSESDYDDYKAAYGKRKK